MQRTVLTLLAALAVMLVAVGGAAAIESDTAIADDQPDNTTDDDMGVCVVGADSPCNGAPAEESATHTENHSSGIGEKSSERTASGSNDSRQGTDSGSGASEDDGQIWIPEDQNRDGEIDERFFGDRFPTALSFAFGLLSPF